MRDCDAQKRWGDDTFQITGTNRSVFFLGWCQSRNKKKGKRLRGRWRSDKGYCDVRRGSDRAITFVFLQWVGNGSCREGIGSDKNQSPWCDRAVFLGKQIGKKRVRIDRLRD